MVDRIMANKPTSRPEAQHVAQLVMTAKQDLRAFGELYLLYAQPVFRYILSRIGSYFEAEDLTAQTFLAALESFPGYRHNGYFASWLFAIARNKVIDHFRRKHRQASLDEAEGMPTEGDLLQQVIKTERVATLSKLIAALPEDEQELIRLRYVAELSFAEMGHLLRQKEDTVKKSVYRLLARLKVQADEVYPMEDPHDG